jgi:hypothetical protein
VKTRFQAFAFVCNLYRYTEVAAALLAASPAGAAERNRIGYLPLHLAVGKEASVDFVSALLEAHPVGAQVGLHSLPVVRSVVTPGCQDWSSSDWSSTGVLTAK